MIAGLLALTGCEQTAPFETVLPPTQAPSPAAPAATDVPIPSTSPARTNVSDRAAATVLAGLRATSVAIIVAANLETPTPIPSPTPRPTPTTTPFPLPTSGLTFTVLVDPPRPAVGDTVTIRVRASGEGRAPRYTLKVRGATSALLLESPASVPAGGLGAAVGWTLRAAGPGTATLTVAVAYEQLVRLSDGTSRFRAAADSSGAVTVTIADPPTATPSPVPSPTPSPTALPTAIPTPRPTPVPTTPPRPRPRASQRPDRVYHLRRGRSRVSGA